MVPYTNLAMFSDICFGRGGQTKKGGTNGTSESTQLSRNKKNHDKEISSLTKTNSIDPFTNKRAADRPGEPGGHRRGGTGGPDSRAFMNSINANPNALRQPPRLPNHPKPWAPTARPRAPAQLRGQQHVTTTSPYDLGFDNNTTDARIPTHKNKQWRRKDRPEF